MRKRAMRGLLAVVLLAAVVATARAAADEDDDAPAAPPKPAPSGFSALWNGLFGSPPKQADKVEKNKPDRPPRPSVLSAAEREMLMRREKEDYARRIKVCIRLREIAQQQNDEAFQERIEALEQKIDELNLQRTASLGQGLVNDETAPEQPKAFWSRANRRNRNVTEDDQ